MAGERLFELDPVTGLKTMYHPEADGGFTLETTQDVEQVMEANKILHADTDERTPYGERLTKVASIPLVIWEAWGREGDLTDPAFLRKKLNDRENLYFRTRPGRI